MIEDKKKGTLVAENEEEALWWGQVQESKEHIKMLKSSIEKAKKDIKMSAREIERKFKDGAKRMIKQKESILKVQKEFMKFCESKYKIRCI